MCGTGRDENWLKLQCKLKVDSNKNFQFLKSEGFLESFQCLKYWTLYSLIVNSSSTRHTSLSSNDDYFRWPKVSRKYNFEKLSLYPVMTELNLGTKTKRRLKHYCYKMLLLGKEKEKPMYFKILLPLYIFFYCSNYNQQIQFIFPHKENILRNYICLYCINLCSNDLTTSKKPINIYLLILTMHQVLKYEDRQPRASINIWNYNLNLHFQTKTILT